MLWLKEGEIHVHDANESYLCKHVLAERKGITVINNDHKRDKFLKVKELLHRKPPTSTRLFNSKYNLSFAKS